MTIFCRKSVFLFVIARDEKQLKIFNFFDYLILRSYSFQENILHFRIFVQFVSSIEKMSTLIHAHSFTGSITDGCKFHECIPPNKIDR